MRSSDSVGGTSACGGSRADGRGGGGVSLLYNLSSDVMLLTPSCSLFPRTGRGAQADSGEPLLWQLPSEWRTEGEPDIIWQWPTQSSGTWQKPVRWEEAAAARVVVLSVYFRNILFFF